ncbi:MAG: 30S ribosomal protein S12 methylthiotransferase RimO [Myxococcales bacterium]|nr:30S ribosomal protein S12 methylthiotransferase RimO [Myxococcales bacterium]
MAKKSIYFVSLGCPKNRVDSEVMIGVAKGAGYRLVDAPEDAQAIVVNTCGFIGEAKKESIDTIFELAELKRSGALKKLVVAGCLSQRYPDELSREMPEVDHFLGSSDMLRLKDVLSGDEEERMLVGNPADWVVRASDPRVITGPRASAYVKIAEGCNRSCAFCTIPQFRGKQRSRPIDDVVREVEQLAAAGTKEVNLISHDTIAYGRDLRGERELPKEERTKLAALVRRVAEVPGIRWVRIFYLYPETMDDELVELIASHPRVVRYVDMPLQHASDAMLKRMKRGHGIDRQRRVVERLRNAIPDLVFRTAFIVGHPGETDADFGELTAFVEWARFEHMGVFRYSDEETCKSFLMDEKVPVGVAGARYRKLMSVQRKIARARNKARVGSTLEVLVEGVSEEHEFVMKGRHAGQAPDIDGQVYLSGGEARAGEMRRVRISQSSDYDLVGELVEEEVSAATKKAAPKKKVGLRVVP